jgi:hypothetical protein
VATCSESMRSARAPTAQTRSNLPLDLAPPPLLRCAGPYGAPPGMPPPPHLPPGPPPPGAPMPPPPMPPPGESCGTEGRQILNTSQPDHQHEPTLPPVVARPRSSLVAALQRAPHHLIPHALTGTAPPPLPPPPPCPPSLQVHTAATRRRRPRRRWRRPRTPTPPTPRPRRPSSSLQVGPAQSTGRGPSPPHTPPVCCLRRTPSDPRPPAHPCRGACLLREALRTLSHCPPPS